MKLYPRCEVASEILIRKPTFDICIIPGQPKMEIDTPDQAHQTTTSCRDGCHDWFGSLRILYGQFQVRLLYQAASIVAIKEKQLNLQCCDILLGFHIHLEELG